MHNLLWNETQTKIFDMLQQMRVLLLIVVDVLRIMQGG